MAGAGEAPAPAQRRPPGGRPGQQLLQAAEVGHRQLLALYDGAQGPQLGPPGDTDNICPCID